MSRGEDVGGGASLTTDPASGSSQATDVSLREHLGYRIVAGDALLAERLHALKELIEERHNAAERAVALALARQQELAEKHNDLIRQGERKDALYATKEDVARLLDATARIVGRETVDALVEKLELADTQMRKDIDAMERRLDLRQGEDAGSRLTKASLYAAIAGASILLGMVVVIVNVVTAP